MRRLQLTFFKKFTFSQILTFIIPIFFSFCFFGLFLFSFRTQQSNFLRSFHEEQKAILQSFVAANYDSIKLREYYNLQKQIPLLVLNQAKTIFFVDDFGQIVGPENFDMSLALELRKSLLFTNREVMGEKIFLNQTTYFAYQQPIFDQQTQQVLGTVYELVDQKMFQSLMSHVVWKFVMLFFILLLAQVGVLFLLIRVILEPLNSFLSRWTAADDLMNTSRDLLSSERTLPKDVLQLAESLSQQLSKHAVEVSLGKISAQMAHDVRGPLAILNGFLEVFKRKASSEDEQLFHEAAERAIFRIKSMTDEMLDSVRAGNVNKSYTNLSLQMRQLIDEAKMKDTDQKITFDLHVPEQLFASIDEPKMYRVLLNIVTNAMQAMSDGGVIQLKAEQIDDKICIEITDSGKGIAPEHLDKLFQSGFSFRKKDGVGLGLVYCYNVIQSHQGSIQVKSKLGEGTTFLIEFPQ